jgi:hypothetical protein
MNDEYLNQAKAQAQVKVADIREARQDYEACGAAIGNGPNPNYRRPTLAQELEKAQAQRQADLQSGAKALDFFSRNPAFDEFITLIREGSIRI